VERTIDTIGRQPEDVIRQALRSVGLTLDFGVMSARVHTPFDALAAAIHRVYAHFPYLPTPRFDDVRVEVVPSPGIKGRLSPSLRFLADGLDPFGAQPRELALPQMEWGLNWCFATLFNRHLLLHSGSLDVDGRGLLLVGTPGSGKSTLTAALALAGHRALSDEFGVVRLADRMLLPFPKPVALKNRSIDVIGRRWQAAVFGPTFRKTHKGDVAHLALPEVSITRRCDAVAPDVIVFPRWQPDSPLALSSLPRAETFSRLAQNSFNAELLGADAFDAIHALVDRCESVQLVYAELDDAMGAVERLCDGAH
jgi:HprK-related kinase A